MEDRASRACGFVLFSPDATVTGVYRDAVDFLSKSGFAFVGYRWTRVRKEELDVIYRRNRLHDNPSGQHSLVDRLFDLDFSLAACVLYQGDDLSLDASYLLKCAKGPSNPSAAKPEHMRSILGAGNKILNFVHTSDSSNEALIEASLFFPICSFWASSPSVHLPSQPSELQQRASINIFPTLLSIKSRLLEGHPNACRTLKGLLKCEQEIVTEGRLNPSRRERIFAIWRKQRDVVNTSNELPLDIKQMFFRLVAEWPSEWCYPSLMSDLEAMGIAIESWEKLIIDCQFAQEQLL